MKTYEIPRDKFELLVGTLAQLELLMSRKSLYLNMTDAEQQSSIHDTLKVIANNDFYGNLAVKHYEN
jgi:hypothetical protein